MELYGKSAPEMVFDLICAKNPKMEKMGITLDMLVFGTPSHLAAPDKTDEEKYGRLNTLLKVSGNTEKNVIGTVTLQYRRIFVDHLFDGRIVSVDGSNLNSPNDILPLLKSKYGMVITLDEVKSITKDSEKATVIFNGSSLAWMGRMDVYLTDMPENTANLQQIIQAMELDGLAYEASSEEPVAAK